MAILDKLAQSSDRRHALFAGGVDPGSVAIDELLSPTRAMIAGKEMILVGTNNYLGLTFDESSLAAGIGAIEREGTGTTGSRMANGSYTAHSALEKELSEFFGREHCIIFSTGYTANLGVISGLVGPGDVVLIDADSHASIYDGCRLSGAEVIRFRHDDADDLDKRLRRLGPKAKDALVVVEGLYSMLGDRADLARMVEVKTRYGAMLVVDEAHSLGVCGKNGRGVAEEAGVEAGVDFIVGTFSKSLGTTGGYCVSHHEGLELLRYTSRPYVFTASLSPALVASTRATLAQVIARPELRTRLWDNVRRLRQIIEPLSPGLSEQPLSPVIPLILKDPLQAVEAWKNLLEQGVYVNLVLPPAAPDGTPLLRISLSAAHTDEDIDQVGRTLIEVLGSE